MKIYAIRDRLIDYYLQPFAGPDEKNVLAAISQQVNGKGDSAIEAAPQHFEIWELGTVDETGHITPTRRLIADCASLIRPDIRNRKSRGQQVDGPQNQN